MRKVVIIGCSGHAAEVRDYINLHNRHVDGDKIDVVGFIDDEASGHAHYLFKEPYLGGIRQHAIQKDVFYLMAIANLSFRQEIVERFLNEGATFTSLIHPTALISPSAQIGIGNVISHNASVGPMVKIGDFNMLNSRCTIGHDSHIGNFNIISPQVAISGNTKIGNGNLFGTNSCTIPGIKVGNHNKIGAGMVVFKPVEDKETVIFRYTEKLIIKDNSTDVE